MQFPSPIEDWRCQLAIHIQIWKWIPRFVTAEIQDPVLSNLGPYSSVSLIRFNALGWGDRRWEVERTGRMLASAQPFGEQWFCSGCAIIDSYSRIASGANRNIEIHFLFGWRQEGSGIAKPQFRIVSLVHSRRTNCSHALTLATPDLVVGSGQPEKHKTQGSGKEGVLAKGRQWDSTAIRTCSANC